MLEVTHASSDDENGAFWEDTAFSINVFARLMESTERPSLAMVHCYAVSALYPKRLTQGGKFEIFVKR